MAEAASGEKSLPASPRKRMKAREEGNVAKSQDLSSAWSLLVAMLALRAFAPYSLRSLLGMARFFFGDASSLLVEKGTVQTLAVQVVTSIAPCVLPLMIIMVVAGLFINVVQVGFMYSPKALRPKFSKLNPIAGFGKFFSARTVMEFAKSMLKLAIVGTIVWITVRDRMEFLLALTSVTPVGLMGAIGGLILKVWTRIVVAIFVLGLIDFGFQKWQYEKDMMMTHKEARDEAKELEGDPRVRQRIRQIQRQMAMQRMMHEVETADVIITNPTTYAVALRYDAIKMPAPVVVAKGARLLAERIREIAVEHNVPIVEKPELARTLYRSIDVGRAVPEKLFRAVAEVLAFVYRIDQRTEKIQERTTTAAPAAAG